MKKKVIIYSSIIVIVDLISKLVIDKLLKINETISIINNFFSITKVFNRGASFSMFIGYRLLFILIGIITIVVLFKYLNNFKMNNRNIFAFSLLIGGIIGNLIDRVIYGYVIDFLDFNIFGYDAPIFNIADTCICIGAFLLFYAIMKREDINEIDSK